MKSSISITLKNILRSSLRSSHLLPYNSAPSLSIVPQSQLQRRPLAVHALREPTTCHPSAAGFIASPSARTSFLHSDLSVASRRRLPSLAPASHRATGAGSLLIGRTSEEVALLEERVKLLSKAGVRAEYLSSTSLLSKEPALEVRGKCGAAFFPDDCQLDALRTVAFIEKDNRCFASEGRYTELYNNPAINIIRSEKNGPVEGIQTTQNSLYCKQALVVAAGAWTGSLMQSIAIDPDAVLSVPVKPRKGHLLVLENFNKIHLNHGLMEFGYLSHKVANSPSCVDDDLLSISMLASTDIMGNLVLGSSRQFVGFNREVDETIIKRIIDCAGDFLPAIRALSFNLSQIRIGHRPYMPDGKPVIGPVPGLPNVFLAAGHEGKGICMALGTAEMVGDMILNNPAKVSCTPFSMEDRFVREVI
ncbi:uncharacterized protein A4U43_C04F19740 [Asparagus officinalis]|uniref:FAD-dependent oxidoreductase domain-containing protein 1 n=1 Tax=Asparagus officinalis TaxID=4686 RepID=A0A5P1F4X9_ASPOF|nr:uncharacterized protein A4U43_C04F19740 [Asparagus officinalis]